MEESTGKEANLHEARINDKLNPINSDARLRDVRRHDNFPESARRRLKNFHLFGNRQTSVQS